MALVHLDVSYRYAWVRLPPDIWQDVVDFISDFRLWNHRFESGTAPTAIEQMVGADFAIIGARNRYAATLDTGEPLGPYEAQMTCHQMAGVLSATSITMAYQQEKEGPPVGGGDVPPTTPTRLRQWHVKSPPWVGAFGGAAARAEAACQVGNRIP